MRRPRPRDNSNSNELFMTSTSVNTQRASINDLPMAASRTARFGKIRSSCAAISILAVAFPIVGISYFAFGHGRSEVPNTLLLTSVLFRHGDRTPTDFYPNDPFSNSSFWPEGFGALTNKGKLNAYQLGEFLRRRYDGFLPEIYSPNDIYIVSSDHDRCLMSAQLALAALYPPRSHQIWKEDLNWQPIPVHTTPRNLDQLIVMKKPCPRYDKEFDDEKSAISYTEEDKKLFSYLHENSGKLIDDIFGAELLYNTLEIEEQRGLELPSWTKSVYPKPLRGIATKSLAYFTETSTLKRLKGGPLLKELISNMADKALRRMKIDRRFFIYSAHDLTLVSLLRTLGVSDPLKPDPVATLLVELHKPLDGGLHFVEIWYKNNTDSENLQPLTLPNCPRPCSLKHFIENTKEVTPKDWDKECQ